ncbi:VOC family protein [Caulobacter sp. RL271]|jgi:catechol 2,3-dioxygenase-like lactoylglutathione lyase family enzyme|uniref:VOC family protein n=1 Tax=Caulobacter segnis TaxID=88688 RepID=A0ABY4ZV77_9CAUL|nr:VOC family protein [Caulobacter segnis]USQ96630.1 VOC family protein [Caulobacter segnis]
MIDHMGVTVRDLQAAKAFYDAAFAPLGICVVMSVTAEETGGSAHYGYGATADRRDIQAGKPSLWITEGGTATGPMHLALVAADRAQVDGFHAAALAAGGTDNGAPGVRPHYHPNYYAAFVLDPDGRNVEAVCHKPA